MKHTYIPNSILILLLLTIVPTALFIICYSFKVLYFSYLTTLILFISAAWHHKVPILLVILCGIFTDSLYGFNLGSSSFLFSIIILMVTSVQRHLDNSKMTLIHYGFFTFIFLVTFTISVGLFYLKSHSIDMVSLLWVFIFPIIPIIDFIYYRFHILNTKRSKKVQK